jgi:hypothetical protein
VGSNPTPSANIIEGKRGKGEKGELTEAPAPGGGKPMGLTYISKNCEIYLGEDSAYREDMGSLPLDCIITEEEYKALPADKKKDYEVLVPKPKK